MPAQPAMAFEYVLGSFSYLGPMSRSRPMAGRIPTFSARSLSRVVAATLLGTFGCVIAALYLDSFNFQALSPAERNRAIVFDIVVPIIIALPLFYYFLSKLRELAIAHDALTIVASTDSLTAVLNRGAFTSLV